MNVAKESRSIETAYQWLKGLRVPWKPSPWQQPRRVSEIDP